MPTTTFGKATQLNTKALNSIVDVEFSDGEKLDIKNWTHLTKGEVELYVGDNRMVLAFYKSDARSQEELELINVRTREATVAYLRNEGFIQSNWIYVGLQNAPFSAMDFFESEEGLDAEV
jgi:hypothetical protein